MTKYSPLSEDKEIVKEYGLKSYHELPKDQKLAFLQDQRREMMGIIWRERVNVLHANRLTRDDNEQLRNKGLENMSGHKNMIRQMKGGIDTLNTLIKELEAEG